MLMSIDIGFGACGWSVWEKGQIVANGLIVTQPGRRKRKSEDNVDRVAQISCALKDIIEQHKIKALVAELPGGSKSASALAKMTMATAVVATIAAILGLPVEWTTALEGKQAVCGKKNASKEEVCEAIKEKYPKVEFPVAKAKFEHIADSAAAYLAAKTTNIVRMYG